MRILWHMPTLKRHTCGLSNRALHFAIELQRMGHVVSFIVADHKTDIDDDQIVGVPIHKMRLHQQRLIHWSLQALERQKSARVLVRDLNVAHDFFISCQQEVVSAYRNLYPRLPVLFVCGDTDLLHDPGDRARFESSSFRRRLPFYLDRLLKRRNEKAAFVAASANVFDSIHTRRIVVDTYSLRTNNCRTIHGAVDDNYFYPPDMAQRRLARKRLGLEPKDRVLAWTGRLVPQKNIDLLIRSLSCCRVRPMRAFIVGDGPFRNEYTALARSQRVSDMLTFTGGQLDVRQYLHAADIFVFPSRAESCGLSLVEAMACGLPCVALMNDHQTVQNASEEMLGNDGCGVLVNSNEPSAWAQAIDDLSSDPEKRRRLGENAARRARSCFTWKSGGQQLNEIIIRIISDSIEDGPIRAARVAWK